MLPGLRASTAAEFANPDAFVLSNGAGANRYPIRGGTDGSRLSFMGLPTPNLFAGEHNFHSRLEWVSAQDMDKAAEVIVELCRGWGGGAVDRWFGSSVVR